MTSWQGRGGHEEEKENERVRKETATEAKGEILGSKGELQEQNSQEKHKRQKLVV